MTLREVIEKLSDKHGGLRAVARVTGISPAYLSRLASGEKVDPSVGTLIALGVEKVVSYRWRERR